jgi:hypothetical protein
MTHDLSSKSEGLLTLDISQWERESLISATIELLWPGFGGYKEL